MGNGMLQRIILAPLSLSKIWFRVLLPMISLRKRRSTAASTVLEDEEDEVDAEEDTEEDMDVVVVVAKVGVGVVVMILPAINVAVWAITPETVGRQEGDHM